MSELKPSTMTGDERLKLITWLESRAQGSTMPGTSGMYKLALDAIRAQPANEPLSIAQLKQMDGEPVWCADGEGHSCYCLVNAESEDCIDSECGAWCFGFYGMTGDGENGLHNMGWLAYRHKPERSENDG